MLIAVMAAGLADGHAAGDTYTLVEGLEKFEGSTAAWNLLQSNGFVVADPSFKQIFQPYLAGPLPCFITPDSAWHTCQVLLAEGRQELETAQSRRLANFSRRLWLAASAQAKSEGEDFAGLAAFAAVAVALQDETFQPELPPSVKTVFEALHGGAGQADAGIGFPLSGPAFRAAGVNAGPPELAGYFAARQWYGSVVFRLSDARETRLALSLAWLIAQDAALLEQWKQLSDPYDALLAPAEGGTLPLYLEAAKEILGADFTPAAVRARLPEIRQALAKKLPAARLNDQLLPPGQAAQSGELTKGFRLLPPRPLPDDLCFASTVAPRIAGRWNPSGLDFMAACAELRSLAAVRALRQLAGDKAAAAAQKTEVGALPDSLYGEEIRLLAKLQQPLPASAAPAMRGAAWADQQLWTQLGAWAEQRHTGAAAAALMVPEVGMINPPTGVVAPYPAFFAGLANLSREAAKVLEKSAVKKPFDPPGIARAILAAAPLWKGGRGGQTGGETVTGEAQQFSRFLARYLEPHRMEFAQGQADPEHLLEDLQTLAEHCASNSPSDAEMKTLALYYEAGQAAPAQLGRFAAVCDRLSQLARKSLSGAALTDEDEEWIRGYGAALAGFESYGGGSLNDLRDDFPIVSRIFASPAGGSNTYAALARPQALYIILPSEGKLRLFRGAVLAYREFTQAGTNLLDDENWRKVAVHGAAPAPPDFTRSFFAEKNTTDLIATLRAALHSAEADERPEGAENLENLLDQLQTRASDADLPALIKLLADIFRTRPNADAEPVAAIIGNLNWPPYQKQLLQIPRQTDTTGAFNTIALILTNNAEGLDTVFLSTNFAQEPPRLRRLYCFLLSTVPAVQPVFDTLARACADPDAGVRWQAALALGRTNGNDPQKIPLLLGRLDDTNEYVAAAAAYILGKIGATNTAPILLDRLNRQLAAPPPPAESLKQQAQAIAGRTLNFVGGPPGVLDVDGLENRLRLERMPVRFNQAVLPAPFTLADALIETFGAFRYPPAQEPLFSLLPGDHGVAAAKALLPLAPERLATRLLTNACDRQADPAARDHALALLPDSLATNRIAALLPLLDDTTVVPHPAGLTATAQEQARARRGGVPPGEWRICDRAAVALSPIMGQRIPISPAMPSAQRDQFILRVREMAKKVQRDPPSP